MSRGSRCAALACALLPLLTGAGAASTSPAKVGERIFLDGLNARDEAVRAIVGQPPMPLAGGAASCAVCHGANARGSDSPSGAAPDVRWSALVRGDRMPRYDERLFARAVTEGIDPSGAPVGPAMPRYALSRSEVAALVTYLKSMPAR